jgi:adenylate cyclase
VAWIEVVGRESDRWDLGPNAVIGRDPGSTVRVSDFLVSRSHAEVRRGSDGRYRLVDLNSTHGTYVAGRKVAEHLLQPGDEIQVGTTYLRFQEAAPAEAPSAGARPAAAPAVQARVEVAAQEQFAPADDQKDAKRLRQDYERLRAAYVVSHALALEDRIEPLLETIVDTAIRILGADRAAIFLLDPETGQAALRAARSRKGAAVRVSVSTSILGDVLAHGVAILTEDARADERFKGAQSIVAAGIRSAMCAPLRHHGEVLGALYCDTLALRDAFQEKDLEIFTAIGSQAAITLRNAILLQRLQSETSARVQFQRFLSPGIVDKVMAGKLKVGQRGEVRRIAVMFLDVRGFTRMSEGMEPAAVVDLLNGFFEIVVDVLFRHDGTLDKYEGDGLMALFGAPETLDDAPGAAVACALEMRDAIAKFNEEQAVAGRPTLAVGIGIHTGPALCGTVGSSKTRQYTAMGDTVNTAARLCAIARGGQILIGETTYEAVQALAEVDPLAPVEVKGKSRPLAVFDVRSMRPRP